MQMLGSGMTPAPPPLAQEAELLVNAGRAPDAWRLLNRRAERRDAEALYLLGTWRLGGTIVRRDLGAARELFRRAAEAGHAEAARAYVAFVGNGTGGPADWPQALRLLDALATSDPEARAERDLIREMALSPAGDPVGLPAEELLSERPRVLCIRGLLSAAECDFLVRTAEPWLTPSLVVDPHSGQMVHNPVRTSEAMVFPWIAESPAVHAFNRRIAAATGTAAAQGEPLQVLRYRGGQQYRPHLDGVTGDPNQRILTALVYLNDGYAGGETQFVRTGLTFSGAKGDALIFANALPDGRTDPEALHAGLPVRAGEKYLASRWIRARPFAFPPPPPLLDL
jgi:prolyl 4-hydroxylase